MDEDKKPTLDRATVEFAATIAGDGVPKITDSDREIWMKTGRLDLARDLQARLKMQEGDEG